MLSNLRRYTQHRNWYDTEHQAKAEQWVFETLRVKHESYIRRQKSLSIKFTYK